MSGHTTFRIGGPADLFLEPETPEEAARIRREAAAAGVPVTVIGGGANILVADSGIRGVTVSLEHLSGLRFEGDKESALMRVGAGLPISTAAEETARRGLGGLTFLAGLPGSTGGALWMNARCYGGEISETVRDALVLSPEGQFRRIPLRPGDFSYKQSPFQGRPDWILEVTLAAGPRRPPQELENRMDEIRRDRREKGHFTAPCAGSAFKNNRDFGRPSGQLIDEAGLRGRQIGGAQIAPWHGNIFINRGDARAADMAALMETARREVKARFGLLLEPEIVFLGSWPPGEGRV